MSNYKDLFYTVPDGLTLYARDYPGPSEQAPVVLCMHGLTRNSRDFAAIAPKLAVTHRVLVVEQRGRGRSDYDSQSDRYQLPNYVGDMLVLLAQQGVTRCATIGTSMGGLMAMAMAATQPALFSHVVLNDIGPVVAQKGLDRIKAYVGSASEFPDWAAAVDYTRRINGPAFPRFSDDDWQAFARNIFIERDGTVVLDYDGAISKPMQAAQVAAVPPDLWPLFEAFGDTPLMLVRGAITDLLDDDCVAEMRRRKPAMRYVEVPDVGHAPTLNEPGVAEAIVDFINGQTAPEFECARYDGRGPKLSLR